MVTLSVDGEIEDYVYYLVDAVRKISTRTVLVVNGEIKDNHKKRIIESGVDVFKRENTGFDSGAYKDALEKYVGWDEVKKYDELILLNDSCYGPVYPLENVFEEMDKREVDFWGITEQQPIYESDYSTSIIPYHIQSYFIAVKSRMLKSNEFKDFWENIKVSDDYMQTVYNFELKFAQYFIEKGFKGGSYVDSSSYYSGKSDTQAAVFFNSYRLVAEDKCPFIKKKAFVFDHDVVLSSNQGDIAYKTLEYINKYTDYDANLILKNLIKNCSTDEISVMLHLDFCITDEQIEKDIDKKEVLIIESRRENESSVCSAFDEEYDICKVEGIEQIFNMENVVSKYKYLCVIGNEDSPEIKQYCVKCLLKDSNYISKVINLFKENNLLGFLCPANFVEKGKPIEGGAFGKYNSFWMPVEVYNKIVSNKSLLIDLEDKRSLKEIGFYGGTVLPASLFSEQITLMYDKMSSIIRNVLVYNGMSEFKNVRKINEDLIEYCRQYNVISIYGTGDIGNECLKYLRLNGIYVDSFVVSDEMRRCDEVNGLEVKEISELELDKRGIVVALNKKHYASVLDNMKKIGVDGVGYYEE